jgi:hypothetical protein
MSLRSRAMLVLSMLASYPFDATDLALTTARRAAGA